MKLDIGFLGYKHTMKLLLVQVSSDNAKFIPMVNGGPTFWIQKFNITKKVLTVPQVNHINQGKKIIIKQWTAAFSVTTRVIMTKLIKNINVSVMHTNRCTMA